MRRISAPKHLNAANVLEFIEACSPIFDLKGKREEKFILDLTKVHQISMLGVLVLYKVVEYSSINQCFNSPKMGYNEKVDDALKKYGFKDLIYEYVEEKSVKDRAYKSLQIKVEDQFIIAPQALLRDGEYSSHALKTKFLPLIESYYSFNPKAVTMIFSCLSEVLLNFWEHAIEDSKSIIVANGNRQHIEIACADTAAGIISTLSDEFNNSGMLREEILAKSVEKGITSKKNTSHMDMGLWLLNQIVNLTKGRMHLYSQGAFYRNDFGKVSKGTSKNWQGTIIYLSLPLKNPVTLVDIEKSQDEQELINLEINWG